MLDPDTTPFHTLLNVTPDPRVSATVHRWMVVVPVLVTVISPWNPPLQLFTSRYTALQRPVDGGWVVAVGATVGLAVGEAVGAGPPYRWARLMPVVEPMPPIGTWWSRLTNLPLNCHSAGLSIPYFCSSQVFQSSSSRPPVSPEFGLRTQNVWCSSCSTMRSRSAVIHLSCRAS